MLGKEVINDKPLTGEAAQMVREEAKKVLDERNKKKRTIKLNIMTKQEAAHLSDVLKAYSEGKKIEVKGYDGKWIDTREDTWFATNAMTNPMSYRIKPEPKYRPYANAEEFLKAQKEHGPFIKSDLSEFCAYYSIRVVHPQGEGITFSYALGAGDREVCYQQLLDEMYWQDGHPCGIAEE